MPLSVVFIILGILTTPSILCHTYLRPPPLTLLPPACLPDSTGAAMNIFGAPVGLDQPPVVSRISALQYRVVVYNNKPRAPAGDEMDMRVRQDLLFQLKALETSLPPELRYETNPNRQTTQIKYGSLPLPFQKRSFH